jgi:hypothetical protein
MIPAQRREYARTMPKPLSRKRGGLDVTSKQRKEEGLQYACAEWLAGDIDLEPAIASFRDDPADNDFQKGYLAGLLSIRTNLKRIDDAA